MEHIQNQINYFIKNKIIKSYPEELYDQIQYFYNNGKRLRPILLLCWSGYKINNIILHCSILVENLHCLSLIIDDLPDMDNDIERRGNPSFHIKYGINQTYFFLYYMFNKLIISINQIDDLLNISPLELIENENKRNILCCLIEIINKNIDGLIDGQFIDIHLKDKSFKDKRMEFPDIFSDEKDLIFKFIRQSNEKISYEKMKEIELNIELNLKKTSVLFTLSSVIGLLLQFINFNVPYNINNVITDNFNMKIPIKKIFNNNSFSKKTTRYKVLRETNHILTGQEIIEKVVIWANIMGYIFQASDDILDIENDIVTNNPNISLIIGVDNTKYVIQKGCIWLKEELENIEKDLFFLDLRLDIQFDIIIEIIQKIEKRIF